MTVACVKLKVNLPNIVIKGESETPTVSKILHISDNSFTLKAADFCRRELRQALACNLNLKLSIKV